MIFKNFYFSSFFVLGISVFSFCSDMPPTRPDKEKYTCGSSILDTISSSIGGYPSTEHLPLRLTPKQEAAVVAVMLNERGGGSSSCSGVLIAPQYVLTAAHCIISPPPTPEAITKIAKPNNISIGFLSPRSSEDTSPRSITLTIPTEQLFIPQDIPTTIAGQGKYSNSLCQAGRDIAIVKLAQAATKHGYEPIPLFFGDPNNIRYNGKTVLSAGFGKNTEYYSERKQKLQWVPLVIGNIYDIDFTTLYTHSPTNMEHHWYSIPEYLHISPCSGDSGGPLFFFDINKNPMVTGVVSTGYPIFNSSEERPKHNCISGFTVFSSTHHNEKFIKNTIPNLNYFNEDDLDQEEERAVDKKPFSLCENLGFEGICSQGYATYCDPDTNLLYSEPCFGQQVCGLDDNDNNRCIPC